MQVIRHLDPAGFLSEAGASLARNELPNGLVLGVAQSLLRQTRQPRRRRPPLLLTVSEEENLQLVIVMTAPHKALLAGDPAAPDAAYEKLVAEVQISHSDLPGIFGPDMLSRNFAKHWSRRAGATFRPGMQQRLYGLEEVVFPDDLPEGSLRLPTFNERELMARWILAFQSEALPAETADLEATRLIADRLMMDDNLFVWRPGGDDNGRPVSMAARARPLEKSISVNLVYTPPELRGRGYASACVAHLSRRLLDEGWKHCTLFTDLANPTSNRLYQRLGYHPIADFDEYRFTYEAQ